MWQKNNGTGEENILQNQFTAYLLTAVKRRKASYIKARISQQQFEVHLDLYDFDTKGGMEIDLGAALPLLDQIENQQLLQALLQAKDRERQILFARVLNERSFTELSKELGISYKAASNSYYRLLERIRQLMKGGREDE